MAVRRSGRALGCRRVCVRDDYGALLYLFGRLPLLAWRGIVLTIGGRRLCETSASYPTPRFVASEHEFDAMLFRCVFLQFGTL
jgi:hypothetical protein